MATRYRLFRRRGGIYYLHDSLTEKQRSSGTHSREDAERVLQAK